MNLYQIKEERENRVSRVFKDNLVFFAFSDSQFQENKTQLQEGEKYVNLGLGAFCPKSKVDSYIAGLEGVEKWFKAATSAPEMRKANIAYELSNHEAFYTGSLDDTLEALGSDYTEEEVRQVYREEHNKQILAQQEENN